MAKISVPARVTNAIERSYTRCSTSRGEGILYSGSSITNAEASPRKNVRRRIHATGTATSAPSDDMPSSTSPRSETQPSTYCASGMNAAISSM